MYICPRFNYDITFDTLAMFYCCLFQLGKSYSYDGQSEAYKYLANYYLKNNQLDAAYQAAQICSEFTEVIYNVVVIFRKS